MDALGIPGAGAQIGVFIVVDFGQPGRHAPGKDAVGELQNFPSGAEVLAQGDQPAPGLAGLIGRVFFQEQPGLGQPEAVDALLYVAHHEPVVLPADEGQNALLKVAGVLIFVHKDVVELFPHRLGRGPVPQRLQGQVFQIVEVQRAPGGLAMGHAPLQIPIQFAQRPELGHALFGVQKPPLRIRKQLFEPVLQALAGLIARRMGYHMGLGLFLDPGNAGKIQGRGPGAQFPIGQRAQRLHLRQILIQHPQIFPGRGVQKRLGMGNGLENQPPGFPQQLVRPNFAAALRERQGALQPGLGIGPGRQKAAQLAHHIRNLGRGAAETQGFQAVAGRLIGRLQGLAQALGQEVNPLAVVQQPEARIHPGGLEVLLDELGAKGVQGADLGALQPGQLLPEARVFLGGLAQPLEELLAHIRGRGPGKGHNQHAVHIRALFQQPHYPLHQHRGLARARGRGQEQVFPPGQNGALLILCPVHRGDSSSFSRLITCFRLSFSCRQ